MNATSRWLAFLCASVLSGCTCHQVCETSASPLCVVEKNSPTLRGTYSGEISAGWQPLGSILLTVLDDDVYECRVLPIGIRLLPDNYGIGRLHRQPNGSLRVTHKTKERESNYQLLSIRVEGGTCRVEIGQRNAEGNYQLAGESTLGRLLGSGDLVTYQIVGVYLDDESGHAGLTHAVSSLQAVGIESSITTLAGGLAFGILIRSDEVPRAEEVLPH